MIQFDIKTDVDEVSRALRSLNVYRHKMKFNISKTVAMDLKNYIRRKYTSHLQKKSGKLYKAIKYYAKSTAAGDDEIAVYVAAKQQYKAQSHEHGNIIRPKKGKYLFIQGADGSIRKVTSVYIPPRPFFFNEGGTFISTKYEKSLVKAFDKELKKAWK
jgi:hypothetical protein